MSLQFPRCPVTFDECDDPGCPAGDRCVLKDRRKLLNWLERRPDRQAEFQDVMNEAFMPVI